ncbi:hypothetical protein KC331_g1450 [Hortaea werneckii]|uniref:RIC1 C-terminal alpha solenoid region domain-containing protein n=1 Tax=Hortaea werneckii TaxID=91943 RepID=A0A3M7CFR5_HORWE|nr:hypothetical protein KC331_g1450 [Hortaea werneckii]KAI7721558.1 hypothetical protein KC353_g1262 [Hortaea werneckii]RMY50834.1 hypothetical protein D0865_06683 [Hortaea werneckii]
MYWPIGAPRVYALSKHAAATTTPVVSHDGSDSEHENTNDQAARGTAPDTPHTSSWVSDEDGGSAHEHDEAEAADSILAVKISRGGTIFATISLSTLTIWQTKPTVALAAVVRSAQSIEAYGPSQALLMRPDGLIIVVQTALGYLITYTLATDPHALVYQTQLPPSSRHTRNSSVEGYTSFRRSSAPGFGPTAGEGVGIREVNLRFRMVIRIDAGISKALALDEELLVATRKPAALQSIRWVAEEGTSQTSTDLLSRMSWLAEKSSIVEMVHDRPMNLACWATDDGKVYAVQRRRTSGVESNTERMAFHGFCFREPQGEDNAAVKLAINARFSLVAVACADGVIDIYLVKDYTGNIPLSYRVQLPAATSSTGKPTFLSYSPDGYCLLAGFEKGWAMWSIYGKLCASSFGGNPQFVAANGNNEAWLSGILDGFWSGNGSELALLSRHDDRIWILDIARNAITNCMSPANVARGLLQSSGAVMLYHGHEVSDLTALPSDASLWQVAQIPHSYISAQWPIKASAVSSDGKYLAVAGRRGLAHYSVASSRWKTFDDPAAEDGFTVRGGLCWHHHFLIAAVEAGGSYQIRVYSREKALERRLHTEELSAPAILITMSGFDSLLVYTYDNTLIHYIVASNSSSAKLVQVGRIGFHGIIRAPPRVRAISWILPEGQLEQGDPSQDVATASVIFLVDGKLVLLQPSTNDHGELKYDMRVIAQNVEYYLLTRDQPASVASLKAPSVANGVSDGFSVTSHLGHSLRDSLWYFDGDSYHVWSDVQDVLASAPADLGRDLPPTVRIPVDFYPMAAMSAKGIVHGLEVELVQRRDVNFSFFRQVPRTQLFLPQLLRYHLGEFNSPAALHLAQSYQHLPYFAHALEVLLHDVLDNEVDNPPSPPETALLPTVVSFLSSFPQYLEIVVNCTRKTELRSWRTLFTYLPPVTDLFEQAMAQGSLQTAAGYLLVLHAFHEDSFQVHEFARLLQQAAHIQDWNLCRELSRFLVGIDSSGRTLNDALVEAGLKGLGSRTNGTSGSSPGHDEHTGPSPRGALPAADYFSLGRER